ncbi:hypothetical protein C0Q70_00651 [Pomacea canaliculata]|uniref:Secreted protein n=1 Tax=Pomacea canaliculata TaxID=400727 RepID=A0A2T7PX81_POMCA|nr:hypothetical protein C0Q70_00651 [Pomacea canaliculata]
MARSWLRIDLTWISLVPVRLHANCSTVTTLLSQRHASWQHFSFERRCLMPRDFLRLSSWVEELITEMKIADF